MSADPKAVLQDPLQELDRLIHEPARLLIVSRLYVVAEADFRFVMRQTGLTWGNLSSHLSKLEDAGYVAIDKGYKGKKPNTMLRLTQAGREAFDRYRQQMGQFLAETDG